MSKYKHDTLFAPEDLLTPEQVKFYYDKCKVIYDQYAIGFLTQDEAIELLIKMEFEMESMS